MVDSILAMGYTWIIVLILLIGSTLTLRKKIEIKTLSYIWIAFILLTAYFITIETISKYKSSPVKTTHYAILYK